MADVFGHHSNVLLQRSIGTKYEGLLLCLLSIAHLDPIPACLVHGRWSLIHLKFNIEYAKTSRDENHSSWLVFMM